MALFHDSAIAGASGQAVGGAYKIERSLRFNSSDSAYLSRTPSTAGNRKTWTWSGWVKRSAIAATTLFSCYKGSGTVDTEYFEILYFSNSIQIAGYLTIYRFTEQVFRDPSAWYHVTLAIDTTNATAAERLKLWVNGSQVTVFSTSNALGLNSDLGVNQSSEHTIGRRSGFGAYFDGYLADIHFIDGQALTPSSFAETNITTGQWVPKAYTGTYGTNGFRLAFADNSNNTATTLGKDSSPNGNNWTPNNLSVTAGAGNDSLVDTPTSYGTDTGAGGEVRGNYATFNPLASAGTFSNGNLQVSTSGSGESSGLSSIGLPASGKWYWEVAIDTLGSDAYTGITDGASPTSLGNNWVAYRGSGAFASTAATNPATAASYTSGDIIGLAFNADSLTLAFYKNGALQGTASNIPSRQYFALCYCYTTAQRTINFGQRPFAYTAPSGYKALCDTNLPAPVVAKPNSVFDVALWTGNGSARSITGLNFNPDFVWIKGRSGATDHALYDVVRGTEKRLESNTTDAEVTSDGGVTAFNSDGFSLGTLAQVNTNSSTYVGWAFDGGTSTVTNTQGSITSQVRANASAGFSIVTYTGNGSGGATIGHGLGVAPKFLIVKARSRADAWRVYSSSIGDTKYLSLEQTAAASTASTVWNNSTPSSTVFTVGTDTSVNENSSTYVAYCFAPVAGYSSFGSYTGNGSADGPFVYTGFRPKWFLVKRTDSANAWVVFDSVRGTFNLNTPHLQPHLSDAEANVSTYGVDFLSNGIKPRATDTSLNSSGGTYIYAAFAENPFQFARAR